MVQEVLFYPLYNDIMAKHIFGYQGRVKFLSHFLEDFFDLDSGTLKDIEILNSVKLDKYNIHDKGLELDILVKFSDGSMLNLEFYSKYGRIAEIKSFVYITHYFRKDLRSGDEYDKVKKMTQINIVKENRMHKTSELVSEYLVINKNDVNDKMLPDLFQIYIFDLDMKCERCYNKNERLIKWQNMFNAVSEEEMKEAIKDDEIMEEIYDEMKSFSKNEWAFEFFNREEFIKAAAAYDAREDNNIEIARNLISLGISVEDISKATNLSLELINNLKNEE